MGALFVTYIYQPFFNILVFIYWALGQASVPDMGIAVIIFALVVQIILLPLNLSADTLWLTRPLVILFLKALRWRRPTSLPEHQSPRVSDKVCDNLWLDETALALPENKRDLYTAHEVLQAKPLFDRGNTHAKFILANSWTKKYLANAYKIASSNLGKLNIGNFLRIENWFLKISNHLAFRLQYRYMKSKITRETITLHSAYFHPNDYALIDLDE